MKNDLNFYKIFYEVGKTCNISKAAENLFISQPAVSKTIKLLEGRLEVKLFERSSKGVILTREGSLLFQHVEKGIREIRIGEEIIEKIKNNEVGNINIGVSTTLGKYYFLPRLEKFIKEYPKFNINITNKSTLETLNMVINNEIEIALISEPFKNDKIEFIKLGEIEDILVAQRGYLERKGIKTEEELFLKGEFMLLEEGNVTRVYFDDYLKKRNYDINHTIEASNMDFLIESTKLGLGITTVIKEFVEGELKEGVLQEIKLDEKIPKRSIGIAYRKNNVISVAGEKLIKFIKELK